jgi:hypothetical protein
MRPSRTQARTRVLPQASACPSDLPAGLLNGNRHWVKGGKVCRVHKNAEKVPDSAGMCMYVHTTKQTVRFW